MTLADCKAWALKEKGPITLVIVQEGIYADDFAEYDADGHSYGYCTPEALDIVYRINPKWPADVRPLCVDWQFGDVSPSRPTIIGRLGEEFSAGGVFAHGVKYLETIYIPAHTMKIKMLNDEAKAATFASDDAPPTEGFVLVDAISPREK